MSTNQMSYRFSFGPWNISEGADPFGPPVRDPVDAAALAVITLHQALRGEVSWGAALAARADGAAFAEPAQIAAVPAFARPVIAWLAGREVTSQPPPGDGATPDERLVIAAVP